MLRTPLEQSAHFGVGELEIPCRRVRGQALAHLIAIQQASDHAPTTPKPCQIHPQRHPPSTTILVTKALV